ncbi:SDR family NAD(P)-dependent oxidoreductase, partial [Escherichia coli]|nr:SDR family NAD(P)-dependent oxidoreductase [Escherichia coli]
TAQASRFTGKVAIVTGASRGIGLAIAQRFVDEGANVIITARGQETLDAAVAQLGDAAIAVAGKAQDKAHQDEVVRTAMERWGRIDVLVNNTGINPVYGGLMDLDDDAARKIADVNPARDAVVDARRLERVDEGQRRLGRQPREHRRAARRTRHR